jgi:hypothetical protein
LPRLTWLYFIIFCFMVSANGWLYECAALRWLCAWAFGRHFRKAFVLRFVNFSSSFPRYSLFQSTYIA